MAKPSTGALAVTVVLESAGLGAAFIQLDLSTVVRRVRRALFSWCSQKTSALGAVWAPVYWVGRLLLR